MVFPRVGEQIEGEDSNGRFVTGGAVRWDAGTYGRVLCIAVAVMVDILTEARGQ